MEDRNPGIIVDETKIPSFAEVRSFFSDEYTFYAKWIAIKEPDWEKFISESRGLELKHSVEYEDGNRYICRYFLDRIVSTTCLIESAYMASRKELIKEG